MIAVIRMLGKGQSARERVRGRLMVGGAAFATFILCAAVNLLVFRISPPNTYLGIFSRREPQLLGALTLALLTIPIGAFIYQVSRLATATRERRLSALRLAGATPHEVRLMGAYESGWQAVRGGLFGGVFYLIFNLTLWWSLNGDVPLLPLGWVVVVIAVVVLNGVLSGLLAGRHVVTSPLGAVRRVRLRQPRIMDFMFVVLGMGMAAVGLILKGRFPIGGPYGATLSIIIGAVILLLGLVLAATWLIRAVARHVAHRATAPETLLAARMIEADPRGWARALSVVGLTVFFGSAVGVQQGIILFRSSVGTFPLATYLLVDSVLLIAMCTSTAALVVRQAEELLDHRRSLAALAAAGAPMRALRQALTRQALIATLPVCAVAAATGAGLAFLIMFEGYNQSGSIAFPIMRAVVTAGIGVLASMLVAQASWPILRSALRPEELRTE